MPEVQTEEFTKRAGAARAVDYFRGAKCKGIPVEKFFPAKRVQPESYQKFCKSCPIQEFCLDFALCFDSYGVWGGLTRKQRQHIPAAYKTEAERRGKEEGWYWILEDVENAVDTLVDAIIEEKESSTSLGKTYDELNAELGI